MAERFVEVDRNTPMLLPAELRDWVPEDDLVHFVIEAVKTLPTGGSGRRAPPNAKRRAPNAKRQAPNANAFPSPFPLHSHLPDPTIA